MKQRGCPGIYSEGGMAGASLYLKEEGNKKDDRGKFIKMEVYAKYCRYTGVRRDIPLNER